MPQPLVPRPSARRRAIGLVAGSAMALLLAGCGANLPPGTAGLRVTAVADPKAGYRPPAEFGGGYGPADNRSAGGAAAAASARDPYRLLDYRNLDDIVVCVTSAGGPRAVVPDSVLPAVVSVDTDHPDHWDVTVASVGDELTVTNPSASAAAIYLRTDAGTVIDLGVASPGGAARGRLTATGGLGVFRESTGPVDDEHLATLFVTPAGSRAQRAAAGETVTFGPLPPGRYLVSTWHPRLPGSQTPVDLSVGQYTTATATVGVNALPKVP